MDAKDLHARLVAADKECRQLLIDLEDARSLPREKVKIGEPAIKRRACLLLEQFYFYDTAPTLVVLELIAACLNVKATPFISQNRELPTSDYQAWDRAVMIEALSQPDIKGGKPSLASVNAISHAAFPTDKKINPHRKTINEWRKNRDYLRSIEVTRHCIALGLIEQDAPASAQQEFEETSERLLTPEEQELVEKRFKKQTP